MTDIISKVEKVTYLDIREQGSMEKLQTALHELKPFKKYSIGTPYKENVPLDQLEKLLHLLMEKYCITIQWIIYSNTSDDDVPHWSVSIKIGHTHEWAGSMQGSSLYELIAKLVYKLYNETQYEEKYITRDEYKKLKGEVDDEWDD